MRIAVKIGTTAWRAWNDAPGAGEVIFDGEVTDTLVWGDDVQNLREPTVSESLTAAKAARIAAINAECRSRLLARYGDPAEQVSRSIGVYGLSEKAALETGIAATVDASNTASDAVTAATTVQAVEAVTVTWPVI